jgi:hypothetical protein
VESFDEFPMSSTLTSSYSKLHIVLVAMN